MVVCPDCGRRMNYNDETAKLTEYACRNCHNVEIAKKNTYRVTS
jgi:predicted RNA-binding Zn-ribbon protein involved in translation (DUF1610 family)